MIINGENGWEDMLPEGVAEIIKDELGGDSFWGRVSVGVTAALVIFGLFFLFANLFNRNKG